MSNRPLLNTLDLILLEVKESSDNTPVDLESIIKQKFTSVSNRDGRAIIEKLIRDGLISTFVPHESPEFIKGRYYQYITFDGLLFIEDGGYSGKKRREEFNAKVLNRISWVVAFGALLSGLYYLIEILRLFC
jgi:hypothetical protein